MATFGWKFQVFLSLVPMTSNAAVLTMPFGIYPLAYQSQDISLFEWFSLLTLCLAPLIAHIIAGVPQASYICNDQPTWEDTICLYNPTSIVWRYAAMTDRRIRAKTWDRRVMAATCSLFWTSRGWDGSEAIVDSSIIYCTRLPGHARITLFSREMVKTLIISLQAIQAIILFLGPFTSDTDMSISSSPLFSWTIDNIFFPLALLSLARLFCAPWLTEDYSYASIQSLHQDYAPQAMIMGAARSSMDSLLLDRPSSPTSSHFRPTSFWKSRLFRALFLLLLNAMLVIPILYSIRGSFTVTGSLVLFLYMILLAGTTAICAYHFICGYTTTTVIPCITSTWYKLYTVAILGLAVVLLIISCIETRKTPCGKYTSYAGLLGDRLACETPESHVIPVGSDSSPWFAITTILWTGSINQTSPLRSGEHWVQNFTGTCLGSANYGYVQRVMTENVEKMW